MSRGETGPARIRAAVFGNPTPLFVAGEALDPLAAAEAPKQIIRVIGDYAWARRTRIERLFGLTFPWGVAAFRQDLARFEK